MNAPHAAGQLAINFRCYLRRDKFTIHSKAVVCQDVDLKGDITIGPGSVIHPKATIFALGGPIIIGSGCIIEEAVILVNRRKEVMRIGDNNLFEIGCRTYPFSVLRRGC